MCLHCTLYLDAYQEFSYSLFMLTCRESRSKSVKTKADGSGGAEAYGTGVMSFEDSLEPRLHGSLVHNSRDMEE